MWKLLLQLDLSLETQILGEHDIVRRRFRTVCDVSYVGKLRLLSLLSWWNSDISFLEAVDRFN